MFLLLILGTSLCSVFGQGQTDTRIQFSEVANHSSKYLVGPVVEFCSQNCINDPSCFVESDDCRFYGWCYKQHGFTGEVKPCKFGLFWNKDVQNCGPPIQANCSEDPCKNEVPMPYNPGLSKYGLSVCGAYWKCKDGYSEGHCCPKGQEYKYVPEESVSRCVESIECIGTHCEELMTNSDICRERGYGYTFKSNNKKYCGMYFTCNQDSPDPNQHCCDEGFSFNETDKACVRDVNCTDPCGKTAIRNACNIEMVNETYFRYKNNGQIRRCGDNTVLQLHDDDQCYYCVGNNTAGPCTEVVNLTFTDPNAASWDMKNQNSWVGATNFKELSKGYIDFSQLKTPTDPAYIEIQHYNYKEIHKIYLQIKFTPLEVNDAQIIVSNCEGEDRSPPSFIIEISGSKIVAKAEADSNVTVEINTLVLGTENFMTLNYDGSTLEVTNTPDGGSKDVSSAPLSGSLKKSTVGLLLGSCKKDNKKQYKGTINEIQIWECKPATIVIPVPVV